MSAGVELIFSPVTPDRWNDVVDLFERKGPRGGTPATDWCWCMWWRERTNDRDTNRSAFERIVADGGEPGLLAYQDGVPVGWISVAPRAAHPQLLRSPTLAPEDPDEPDVYSITCFYVHPSAQRQGIRGALLDAAVEHARSRGATAVEGYPSSARTARTDFMGTTTSFAERGFAVGPPVRRSRSIARLDLGDER